jgi:NADPH:quinone reductase-like Zn-dependent oxidoreductase
LLRVDSRLQRTVNRHSGESLANAGIQRYSTVATEEKNEMNTPAPPPNNQRRTQAHAKAIRIFKTGGPEALEFEDLDSMAVDLFSMVKAGKIRIDINQRYALRDAVAAHRDLESRKTTGSSILVP